MYYPPNEIKTLNVKTLNKLFYFRHKRMPTINEIWHMQNYGEVKKLKYKSLQYITKQKTIIAKIPKKKCFTCNIILQNQKARYCQKCAKESNRLSFLKSREKIKKNKLIRFAEKQIMKEEKRLKNLEEIDKYKKAKKEVNNTYEKQVIKSNNELRKKAVLEYHKRAKTELSEKMLQVLSKY